MSIASSTCGCLEVIHKTVERGAFKSALFDFDGTISLIRQGWQQIMVPYFTEVLLDTPHAEEKVLIAQCAQEFIDLLTGKQTIYQCIRLAEEVQKRGGLPKDPLDYKEEYHRRLMERIHHRIVGLQEGKLLPEELVVPGSIEFLEDLRNRGLILYLASGTDEQYVLEEAELLGVSKYFNGGIHGARDEYQEFSKAKVIQQIIASHDLAGHELVGFGDGYVEIENVKSVQGFAVGVASDEEKRTGVDEWKRNRLIRAGADIIIPDFQKRPEILQYLFLEGVK